MEVKKKISTLQFILIALISVSTLYSEFCFEISQCNTDMKTENGVNALSR